MIVADFRVLKKNKSDNRVCFIDASNEFVHEGNKNKLSDDNIKKIFDTHCNKEEIQYFSKVVTIPEIENKKFNLSVSTYVEKEDTTVELSIEEITDIIKVAVEKQNTLRTEFENIINSL